MNDPVRLTRRATPWFDAAIRTHALGERVIWELTFVIIRTPAGDLMPVVQLYTEIPTAMLGAGAHIDVAQIPAAGLDEARADAEVRAALDRLLQRRTAELAVTNGHGEYPK